MTNRKQTSARVATVASKLLRNGEPQVRKVAGSALAQTEVKTKKKGVKRATAAAAATEADFKAGKDL
jgi:predicted regulator of Ras-like GTPase activity (Roadblock/LC7/MglB family)